MEAHEILEAGAGHLKDRAETYDKDGERSMGATVSAFEAITSIAMTEEQGWLFMALLKAVRTQQGSYRADNYEDGAAYFALAGETASRKHYKPLEQYQAMVAERESYWDDKYPNGLAFAIEDGDG